MELIDYEITGFVEFPHHSAKSIKTIDSGRTNIYIIAYDENAEQMIQMLKPVGCFCGDDMSLRQNPISDSEQLIEQLKNNDVELKDFYFRDGKSFNIISNVLIGWSSLTYEYLYRNDPWCCTFRDLTNEGKKLYYSMKKLHNNSEIRILTFNNIK